MDCAVFDTYVRKKEGDLMHFDIVVPNGTNEELVYKYGKEYLSSKGQDGQPLSSKECRFCHMEHILPYMESDIKNKGYFIIEMKGC